eukprot:7220619-Karenia_brevis.AAC.1
MGIVLANLSEGSIRDHLIMSSERLATWVTFRTELEQIFRVRAASQSTPMDVGALRQGDGLHKAKSGGTGDGRGTRA